MATVRNGRQSVLVVVDVQVAVMAEAWDAPRIVRNVVSAVESARGAGVPVIWVQHADEELVRGSDDWQLVPELEPGPGEPVIHKSNQCSFEDTELDKQLARLGATRVVLCGAATNWCIRATAYGALDRGYDLTLLSNAHSTGDMSLEDGDLIQARHIVKELNTVMTWIRYPGRTSSTAGVEDVDWA